MDGPVTTPHEILNPEALPTPRGFSHAVAASGGRTLYLGGQAAHDADGRIAGESVVEQFDRAAANVVTVLEAAGGKPEDLTSMMIYVTDAGEYRASLKALGDVYRRRFGSHYPAIALFEVAGLFDPAAKVELVCTAVLTATARGQ
jgi:enamine deaminase RidA (YjgF/YER057c/UK114 family)